jgi:hypothetical protein
VLVVIEVLPLVVIEALHLVDALPDDPRHHPDGMHRPCRILAGWSTCWW